MHEADALEFDLATLRRRRAACASWATCRTTSPRRCCSGCIEQRRAHPRHALHAAEGSRGPHGRGARLGALRAADGHARAVAARRAAVRHRAQARSARRRESCRPSCDSTPHARAAAHRAAALLRERRRGRLLAAAQDVAQRAEGAPEPGGDRARRASIPARARSQCAAAGFAALAAQLARKIGQASDSS